MSHSPHWTCHHKWPIMAKKITRPTSINKDIVWVSVWILMLLLFSCDSVPPRPHPRHSWLPLSVSVSFTVPLWWRDCVSHPAVWHVLRYLPPHFLSLWLHQASLCHSSCSCVPTLYPPLWIQLFLSHIKGSYLEGLFSIRFHLFSCTFWHISF